MARSWARVSRCLDCAASAPLRRRTKKQYEASVAAVRPGEGKLPGGPISHAAGPSVGGWTIIAVHESKESWERFRHPTLVPRQQAGIEGGSASPPQETEIDSDTLTPKRKPLRAAATDADVYRRGRSARVRPG